MIMVANKSVVITKVTAVKANRSRKKVVGKKLEALMDVHSKVRNAMTATHLAKRNHGAISHAVAKAAKRNLGAISHVAAKAAKRNLGVINHAAAKVVKRNLGVINHAAAKAAKRNHGAINHVAAQVVKRKPGVTNQEGHKVASAATQHNFKFPRHSRGFFIFCEIFYPKNIKYVLRNENSTHLVHNLSDIGKLILP
jgi:hypothetical protein